MYRILSSLLVAALLVSRAEAQGSLSYNVPTHYYGIFAQQLTSARAAGMGQTTITLNGIEHSLYNPASISPGTEKYRVHANYASGDPVRPGSKYPFLGATFRINDKLSVGAMTFSWVDNDPVWTTIIGSFEESVDKRSQTVYSVSAAYQVIPNLHIGLSGNYLQGKAVPGSVTSEAVIGSLGAIYDRDLELIKNKQFSNQKIRAAFSLVNFTMNNKEMQHYQQYKHYRDLPIYLHLGAAYRFSLPFNPTFTRNKKYFDGSAPTVDLGLHLQFRDQLPGKDPENDSHKYNSSIGIGAEAWFLQRVAFRLGYYREKRPSGTRSTGGAWVTGNKYGFTWGYGTLIPLRQLTKNKIPFNAELNFVTGRLLNELGKNYTHPSVFTDSRFTYSIGLTIKP